MVGCEKEWDARYFVRLADKRQRQFTPPDVPLLEHLRLGFVYSVHEGHGRVNETWSNRVGQHSVWRKFYCQRFSEADERALRRNIGAGAAISGHGLYRRNCDDTTVPLPCHMRRNQLT